VVRMRTLEELTEALGAALQDAWNEFAVLHSKVYSLLETELSKSQLENVSEAAAALAKLDYHLRRARELVGRLGKTQTLPLGEVAASLAWALKQVKDPTAQRLAIQEFWAAMNRRGLAPNSDVDRLIQLSLPTQ